MWVMETTFLGERAICAGNDELAFTVVPAWGSNLISIVHKPTGRELLRTPATAEQFRQSPVLYGTPVLFPPNRIADGSFTYRGREYRFHVNEPERRNHLHGFVYDRPWEVVRADIEAGRPVVETQFAAERASDWHEIAGQFPHHFIITMRYELDGNGLHKSATVHNDGGEPLPLGIGFHTCFRFPKTARLALTVAKRWVLDERMLPTGAVEETSLVAELRRGMNLAGVPLDDAFLADTDTAGDDGPNEAKLLLPEEGMEILYRVDASFKHWVVYNRDGESGFICPEPYTWVTNAPNLPLPPELTGFQELLPGESKTFSTSIAVSVTP